MVEQQLKPRGIKDERVLAAMAKVPREEFIPPGCASRRYEDGPLPIGYDQTISQPYIVAFMTEQLRPKPSDRVLEIGSGSGYQAAILAELVADVYTMEIVPPLAKTAEATLQRLGYKNVHVKVGDGYKGWPEEAPFDAIIVTCAPEKVPQPLVDQLKEGGRMVIPVGERFAQQLYLLEKKNGQLKESVTLPVRFVPMLREAAEAITVSRFAMRSAEQARQPGVRLETPLAQRRLRYSYLIAASFFQINALDPLLQFAGLLVLQLDLDKIAIGDHYPQRGVLAFLFECLETGIAIDGHRFGVTFAGVAVAIPRFGRRANIIRVCNGIENADRGAWRFFSFAFVIIAMHVRDFESAYVFGRTLRFICSPTLRRFRKNRK